MPGSLGSYWLWSILFSQPASPNAGKESIHPWSWLQKPWQCCSFYSSWLDALVKSRILPIVDGTPDCGLSWAPGLGYLGTLWEVVQSAWRTLSLSSAPVPYAGCRLLSMSPLGSVKINKLMFIATLISICLRDLTISPQRFLSHPFMPHSEWFWLSLF